MKSKPSRLALAVASLIIVVISLAFMLCDIFIPLSFWTHPALNFLFCLLVGFGAVCMALGFVKISPWYFFLSAILLGLALIYALLHYIAWWIGLIIVAVVWVIFAIISFMIAGNKTEDISLNKSPDYKTYAERKEIKEEQENKKEISEKNQ